MLWDLWRNSPTFGLLRGKVSQKEQCSPYFYALEIPVRISFRYLCKNKKLEKFYSSILNFKIYKYIMNISKSKTWQCIFKSSSYLLRSCLKGLLCSLGTISVSPLFSSAIVGIIFVICCCICNWWTISWISCHCSSTVNYFRHLVFSSILQNDRLIRQSVTFTVFHCWWYHLVWYINCHLISMIAKFCKL